MNTESQTQSIGDAGFWAGSGAGRTAHLCGIGGVGMAGLGLLLKARGWNVTGCDIQVNERALRLKSRGIAVCEGHSPTHVDPPPSVLIRSTAVPNGHPEVEAARRGGALVLARGEVLPRLLDPQRAIAVAGTHGKTTTSTFVAHLLRDSGLAPSWCVGWESELLGDIASGDATGLCVVEADESDGTLAGYSVGVAVVTNLDFDHAEYFADMTALEHCFAAFLQKAAQAVVYCGDDDRLAALVGRVAAERAVSFGFGARNAVRAEDVCESPTALSFTLRDEAGAAYAVRLPIPGRYNVLNALAALCAARAAGVTFDRSVMALVGVGLPRRRFEIVYRRHGVEIVTDYAHHPAEIRVLLQTARLRPAARRIGVFQPHRFSRTAALMNDFADLFGSLDLLLLAPVYAASEAPRIDGCEAELYRRIRLSGSPPGRAVLAPSLDVALAYLRIAMRTGDQLLAIGAGTVDRVARQLAAEFADRPPGAGAWRELERVALAIRRGRVRRDVPLAPLTTLKLGGAADLLVEPDDEAELAEIVRVCRDLGVSLKLLGGGANTLVSDLGVRGVTVRLSAPAFQKLTFDGESVHAGAGVSLRRLLAFCARRGRGGLEFLCCIPGLLGGALAMNAGAWGEDIAGVTLDFRCLKSDGEIVTVMPDQFKAGYRRMGAIEGCVALSATLRTVAMPGEVRRQRLREVAKKRQWQRGLRSAGSVFLNPSGDFAGRLIEAAGLKGFCVGGVEVSAVRANVFTASDGAIASDMAALIALVRDKVEERFGVRLAGEVRFLH